MRAIILVMDSVGIGSAPDASAYGDLGANTVGHIAEACAGGAADGAARTGRLNVPNLISLGLADACRLATGHVPPFLDVRRREGRCGCAAEISKGKDTPSGHWELAGVPVTFDWGYFPRTIPCFPDEIVSRLCKRAGLPGILGNCHASGTEIIAQYGDEHIQSGKRICYTSA
ncbi:MAG TPA: phosphopentomutase, partial [Bradyrhizobium sp.]|nr:phosphopentomutase [Bradyrhizobium sp.]